MSGVAVRCATSPRPTSTASRRVEVLRGVELRRSRPASWWHRRPLGLRQVDAAAPARRPRPAGSRHGRRSAERRWDQLDERSLAGVPQPHPRLRLPVPPAAARLRRARERHAARPHRRLGGGRRSAAGAWRCSTRSVWPSAAATSRTSSRAASASASRSAARWCSSRRCCSPTSRPATSTRQSADQVFELLLELQAAPRHDRLCWSPTTRSGPPLW